MSDIHSFCTMGAGNRLTDGETSSAPNCTGAIMLLILAFASDYTRWRFPFIALGFFFTFCGFVIYASIDVTKSLTVAYYACFMMVCRIHTHRNFTPIRRANTSDHIDMGNLGALGDPRCVVQQQHRRREPSFAPHSHRRARCESDGSGLVQHFPKARRSQLHPRTRYHCCFWRNGNRIDIAVGRLDDF